MTTEQPETLRIADALRHSIAHYGREDTFTLDAYEAEKRLRSLHAENEMLRTGYNAARLEIASLRTDHMQALAAHPQNAEKLPRVPLHETVKRMADRIEELQDQLEAIGAGGVEPLRKRCLHQISEPGQAGEYPELPMNFASSGYFSTYRADQMRAYADATCAARAAQGGA